MVTQLGKPKLGVDIDNVLANADVALRKIIRRETGGLVDLAYGDVREFDYRLNRDRNGRSIDDETWRRVHSAFSTPEILLSLPVIAGAVDGLRLLSDVFDVHFVTSRLPEARLPTVRWLESLGLDFPYRVHFARHREKHLCPLGLNAVVEDDREQAALFADAGVASILLAHPWNEMQDGSRATQIVRCGSWGQVVAQTLELSCGMTQHNPNALLASDEAPLNSSRPPIAESTRRCRSGSRTSLQPAEKQRRGVT